MYAMTGTRPDLAAAVSVVSKYLDRAKPTHVALVRRIWKYLRSNLDVKLHYQSGKELKLEAYCDAAYANDEGYQSRLGYGCLLAGGLISWYSGTRKRKVPEQSAAEAEYHAAVSTVLEYELFGPSKPTISG